MGRKKLQIVRIDDRSTRALTFKRRQVSLMKKAMELNLLCGSDVCLLVFGEEKQLTAYSNQSIPSILNRFSEFEGNMLYLDNSDYKGLNPGRASSFRVGTAQKKLKGEKVLTEAFIGDVPTTRSNDFLLETSKNDLSSGLRSRGSGAPFLAKNLNISEMKIEHRFSPFITPMAESNDMRFLNTSNEMLMESIFQRGEQLSVHDDESNEEVDEKEKIERLKKRKCFESQNSTEITKKQKSSDDQSVTELTDSLSSSIRNRISDLVIKIPTRIADVSKRESDASQSLQSLNGRRSSNAPVGSSHETQFSYYNSSRLARNVWTMSPNSSVIPSWQKFANDLSQLNSFGSVFAAPKSPRRTIPRQNSPSVNADNEPAQILASNLPSSPTDPVIKVAKTENAIAQTQNDLMLQDSRTSQPDFHPTLNIVNRRYPTFSDSEFSNIPPLERLNSDSRLRSGSQILSNFQSAMMSRQNERDDI